ncbi:Six-hairpin glycosidase [Lojkania enalia]|uniref:Six-hairpin glycosidase n=1 Tax=Lojkania enalia TaxID=147567 RepID=A0A9P4JX56_9PLEO|nr:Six-hairpin glycosidase [Didymosphaeria enalia]
MKYPQSILCPLLFIGSAVADQYVDNAHTAVKTLQDRWYDANNGLWKVDTESGHVWWQSGNMIETIAKFGIHDPSFKQTASDIVANTYAKAANQFGANNWINDFYDDNGWWALGWIASYDLTGDVRYLNTAKDIFEDMTGGWTTPCNGGIWWSKHKEHITAISNELFLSVAAHLANRVPENEKAEYRNWAIMEWDWFSKSGMINGDNVINDGIRVDDCQNNGEWVYTYNQGVVLAGLSELARATSNGYYIEQAYRIAGGALNALTDNGILIEKVPTPGGIGDLDEQGMMFKGVFVRGLSTLNENAPRQDFWEFLKRNADSVWSKDRDGEGVIGPRWQGPSGLALTTSHASGIDALVAAAQANV